MNNPIKDALVQGKSVIGTMIVQVHEPAVVQLFAEFGLEYFFIDMEHGPYTIESAATLIQAGRLAGITPLVRVGETQYHLYSKVLDAGAMGIMTPRVESVEQVKTIMKYTKYPPLGERGFSRLAAHVNFSDINVADYVPYANENIINIIQIESKKAVENIEDLISVPGVDGVIVGMDDLSLSAGMPGDTRNPVMVEMLECIVAACQKHGIPWGLHIPDTERLEKWIRRGMQLVTYSSDIWMFQQVLRQDVKVLRNAIAAYSSKSL